MFKAKQIQTIELDAKQQRRVQYLKKLARLLDYRLQLPGGFAVGLDALIGLIPGVGDLIGLGFSGYLIVEAWRLGLPTRTLWKMVFNVLIDTLVGTIPVAGDVFDFYWQSNVRNMDLLLKAGNLEEISGSEQS